MAATAAQCQHVLGLYDGYAGWLHSGIATLVDDADTVVAEARAHFEALIPELPYVDRPDHSMATSMFACAVMLAVYQALRERNIDAHAWGQAIHALPVVTLPEPEDNAHRTATDGAASQQDAAPNEFVFEVLPPDGESGGGMNVTSCAICHLFSRHDAMPLVPYMCAYDDAMSRAQNTALRRTGTLALGATHCDFRYQKDTPALPLAPQYPDQIRLNPRR